jgi:hypothetical protein
METQEFRVMIQLTLGVDINKTKEDVKNLVNAYIINEKCEHIDVMMQDIIEVRDESEIYETEVVFYPCEHCNTGKMCRKENGCYLKYKNEKNSTC